MPLDDGVDATQPGTLVNRGLLDLEERLPAPPGGEPGVAGQRRGSGL